MNYLPFLQDGDGCVACDPGGDGRAGKEATPGRRDIPGENSRANQTTEGHQGPVYEKGRQGIQP